MIFYFYHLDWVIRFEIESLQAIAYICVYVLNCILKNIFCIHFLFKMYTFYEFLYAKSEFYLLLQ